MKIKVIKTGKTYEVTRIQRKNTAKGQGRILGYVTSEGVFTPREAEAVEEPAPEPAPEPTPEAEPKRSTAKRTTKK